VKVLLDNNLSPAIARALHELFAPEHEIVALRDKFDPKTIDAEWIPALSREGRWVVISGDRRITRNKAEYEAFRNSRLVGFFLAKGLYKAKVTKQMERLLALWERMETLATHVEGGAMFELQMKSSLIKQLKP
jgi:PIN domain-containing protein